MGTGDNGARTQSGVGTSTPSDDEEIRMIESRSTVQHVAQVGVLARASMARHPLTLAAAVLAFIGLVGCGDDDVAPAVDLGAPVDFGPMDLGVDSDAGPADAGPEPLLFNAAFVFRNACR